MADPDPSIDPQDIAAARKELIGGPGSTGFPRPDYGKAFRESGNLGLPSKDDIVHWLTTSIPGIGEEFYHEIAGHIERLIHDFKSKKAKPKPPTDYEDIDPITGKKWTKISAADLTQQPSTVVQYDPTYPHTPAIRKKLLGELQKALPGYKLSPSTDLTDKEYDILRQEAAKGNEFAQNILRLGAYQAQPFPTMQQDVRAVLNPFVQGIAGLQGMANALDARSGLVQAETSFPSAESQVNTMLSQMGVSPATQASFAPSAETSSFVKQLSNITAPTMGGPGENIGGINVPSMSSALQSMVPLEQMSEKYAPYEQIINALLSHQQYETIYGYGPNALAQNNTYPGWLQDVINKISGSGPLGFQAAAGATKPQKGPGLGSGLRASANPLGPDYVVTNPGGG